MSRTRNVERPPFRGSASGLLLSTQNLDDTGIVEVEFTLPIEATSRDNVDRIDLRVSGNITRDEGSTKPKNLRVALLHPTADASIVTMSRSVEVHSSFGVEAGIEMHFNICKPLLSEAATKFALIFSFRDEEGPESIFHSDEQGLLLDFFEISAS